LIDPRAIIDPKAELAADVHIGPFSIIGSDVVIGAGTRVGPHVVINGPARIGCDNKIFQFSSLGEMPQDKKYRGEPTLLEIGDRNVIREFCTFNRGTEQGGGVTRIGDDNWIMAYVHLAHDCVVGNNTIFANNASLAGHVVIEDHVILGGFSQVHQFCSLGEHSFTAFGSGVAKDVPPFVMVAGHPAAPHGLNVEGLRRRGFSTETIAQLRRAYKLLYRSNLTLKDALAQMRELAQTTPEVEQMIRFLEKSSRGILR